MNLSRIKSAAIHLVILILLLSSGCKKEEVKAKVVVNSFSMQVNEQLWTPHQSPDDPCKSTYSLSFGSFTYTDRKPVPRYIMYAYKDPNGRDDAYSENMLRMQVLKMTEPGIYLFGWFV